MIKHSNILMTLTVETTLLLGRRLFSSRRGEFLATGGCENWLKITKTDFKEL